MGRRAISFGVIFLALGACAPFGCKDRGVGKTPPVVATIPQSPPGLPYEIMARSYAPYTASDDPLGFPMKVRNLAPNGYRFWRGARELFYEWCKTNVPDWMHDAGAYVRIHGDL